MKIAFGIIALLFIIGGVFILYNIDNTRQDDRAVTAVDQMTDDSERSIGSILSLMVQGKSLECTFKHDEDGNRTEGSVYITGERMRGYFILTQPNGKQTEAHVIRDTEYAYTWGGVFGDTKGTKLKHTSVNTQESAAQNDATNFLDNDTVSFDCKKWNVDESVLTPPFDIDFQDISTAVMEIQDVTLGLEGVQCSACESIPDEATKANCLQALGC